MTSFACVPVGRLMLSDEALLAVPLLLVAEPRYPMMYAPGQVSATSHSPAAARHTAPGLPGKCWQLVLVPSQVSSVQGSPSSAQLAPALPAGCWQVVLEPSHWSRVQGLPSSVQAAPAFPAGCWQALFVPSHWSRVQGLLSAVQPVPAGCFTSVAGQVVLVPSQVSAT